MKKNNPTSKNLRLWNLCLELDLAIICLAIVLMISFENHILVFYIWLLNTTIKGSMKKTNLNNTLLLLLGIWPKKSWF